jgi:site-specific DNA-methyltransferase (adenine-specific)
MADDKLEQGQLFDLSGDLHPIIRGFPELRWTGKHPFTSTEFFPAQLKERYGSADSKGWYNKIYWGDNLQIMSHLLKDFSGKVNLIYIDPPFDSKADYKKKISLRGSEAESDSTVFEEKQYGDIWTNDEYLQFMYERLILMRELLAPNGTIYLHCDYHKDGQLRCLLDEVFGPENFLNEIIWYYRRWNTAGTTFSGNHDTIFAYCKHKGDHIFNQLYIPKSGKSSGNGRSWVSVIGEDGVRRSVLTKEVSKGVPMPDVWNQDVTDYYQSGSDFWEISMINPVGSERLGYPTQKPEKLLERIILASSNPGDLVFDGFMGSGTTQAVALKLGRRFIGADINLGAIQTATMRLLKEMDKTDLSNPVEKPGFEVFNVNNYDFFRNPQEAKQIILKLLELQPFAAGSLFDGEKDGRLFKIMPTNRIATKADVSSLVAGLPYSQYDKRMSANPSEPVDRITLVCMGHEPDFLGSFKQETQKYNIDVEVHDILVENKDIQLKRDSEVNIVRENGKIVIKSFYPMNLLQKLNMLPESVQDWKQLVDSVLIDWNFDGKIFQPTLPDVPEEQKLLVRGEYVIPSTATKIRVKITDLLSESIEVDVQ